MSERSNRKIYLVVGDTPSIVCMTKLERMAAKMIKERQKRDYICSCLIYRWTGTELKLLQTIAYPVITKDMEIQPFFSKTQGGK